MRVKYFPPKYDEKQFHCIHCGVFAQQRWYDTWINKVNRIQTGMRVSECTHCGKWAFWFEERMVVPADVPVEPPHNDLPDDCKKYYTEAMNVFGQSPRSAAALLRLCIQNLMPHLGQSGKNVNDDIGSLVTAGLPVLVQKGLDFCRVVGNHAVHPGEIELEDTPEVALSLFNMINFIVEDRITRPREIETLYNQLPESNRKAIEERDARRLT